MVKKGFCKACNAIRVSVEDVDGTCETCRKVQLVSAKVYQGVDVPHEDYLIIPNEQRILEKHCYD
jgi:hypothetical protein